jgi:hypothetical protein
MVPANADNYVAEMQRDWRALPIHVNSKCGYESKDTYGVRIVDAQSTVRLVCFLILC